MMPIQQGCVVSAYSAVCCVELDAFFSFQPAIPGDNYMAAQPNAYAQYPPGFEGGFQPGYQPQYAQPINPNAKLN